MRRPKMWQIRHFKVDAFRNKSEMLVMIRPQVLLLKTLFEQIHGIAPVQRAFSSGWVLPDLRTAGLCLHVVSSWIRGAVQVCGTVTHDNPRNTLPSSGCGKPGLLKWDSFFPNLRVLIALLIAEMASWGKWSLFAKEQGEHVSPITFESLAVAPMFQNVLLLPAGGLLLGDHSEGGAAFRQPIGNKLPCTSLLI